MGAQIGATTPRSCPNARPTRSLRAVFGTAGEEISLRARHIRGMEGSRGLNRRVNRSPRAWPRWRAMPACDALAVWGVALIAHRFDGPCVHTLAGRRGVVWSCTSARRALARRQGSSILTLPEDRRSCRRSWVRQFTRTRRVPSAMPLRGAKDFVALFVERDLCQSSRRDAFATAGLARGRRDRHSGLRNPVTGRGRAWAAPDEPRPSGGVFVIVSDYAATICRKDPSRLWTRRAEGHIVRAAHNPGLSTHPNPALGCWPAVR
jgi:hypothetical protein